MAVASASTASYNPADIADDEWFMRTTAVGDSVAEVTFTIGKSHRLRHARLQYAILTALAVIAFITPSPTVTAVNSAFESRWLAQWVPAVMLVWVPVVADILSRIALLGLVKRLLPQPVVQESVVAMRGLGLQMRALRADGAQHCHFIDAHSLKAVIVNEGIQMCDVRYYLALVVSGRRNLVLLFDAARPRLPCIGRAYRLLLPTLFPDSCAADCDRYLDAIGR